MNLIEGLQKEIERNKELLEAYESIPQGGFGAHFIRQSIEHGEKAIAEHDTVEMVHALASLKENN